MPIEITKSPKSPRYSLPWAVNKMLLLLEKEGLHPVAPDIMAQHLGYSNASNGQAATVLGTLRMYGLILKAAHRKDVISEDVKKFKYTPYSEEKLQLASKWLKSPKLFASVLAKYSENLPSDPALRYELIQEHNFTEEAANKFIAVLKDSIAYARSFEVGNVVQGVEIDVESDDQVLDQNGSDAASAGQSAPSTPIPVPVLVPVDNAYRIQIIGPGMNSTIEINEEEDLLIVEAMLKKVGKKLFAE